MAKNNRNNTLPHSINEIRSIFDEFSKSYTKASDTQLQRFFRGRFKKIIKKYSKGNKILEIGCGNGLLLNEIHNIKIWDLVVGIDISSEMLKQADNGRTNQILIQADGLHNIPFIANTFDTIVCVYGPLSYARNITVAFKEMCRVMKKSGILIGSVTSKYRYDSLSILPVNFDNSDNIVSVENSWIKRKIKSRVYNSSELKMILSKFFGKIELFGIGFVPIIGREVELSIEELINLEIEYEKISPFIDLGMEIGFVCQKI